MPRSVYYYQLDAQAKPDSYLEVKEQIQLIFKAHKGRYGYRRVTALLRDAGWHVNRKRVERIWRREGLKVPQKQPKRGRLWLNDGSCIRLRPEYPGHVWAYDFVEGTVSNFVRGAGYRHQMTNLSPKITANCSRG